MRWAAAGTIVLALAACGVPEPIASSGIGVVAAENFWGSLASQLGGSKVSVRSIVTDPNADPHEHESSAADARAFADARLVILNGAGYDTWGEKLVDANPSSGRRVLDVGGMLGKRRGDDPHFWYSPAYVVRVVDRITAEYTAIDPAGSGYFDQRHEQVTARLQPYLGEVATIRQRYAGTPIGSTETVFAYMAGALGLDLTTPEEFMNAVSDGTDPPIRAVAKFHDQISGNQVKLLVYNTQTSTAVTTDLRSLAASRHIPTVGVSETIQPANLDFQGWQLAQLRALDAVLKAGR